LTRNRPKPDRQRQIWKKSNGVCAHCGKHPSSRERTIDHFVPRSAGGGFDMRNLLPLCKTCNQARSSKNIDPYVFYKYALPDAIKQCVEYAKEFDETHSSMSGEMY